MRLIKECYDIESIREEAGAEIARYGQGSSVSLPGAVSSYAIAARNFLSSEPNRRRYQSLVGLVSAATEWLAGFNGRLSDSEAFSDPAAEIVAEQILAATRGREHPIYKTDELYRLLYPNDSADADTKKNFDAAVHLLTDRGHLKDLTPKENQVENNGGG